MELKEFSHKGEAIEKEIKKEFQFMGRTIKKRRVGLIIAAAGVIAAIAVALFIHSQQFDVWDYITISYEGANGYAKPVFTLNKDKLYKALMGKSTDSDKSYNVKMLIASIETSTDAEDIANGDTYKVRLEIDKKYEDAAGVSVGDGTKKIKASGIAKGTSVVTENIFENRYKYMNELKRMGAKVTIEGKVAIIKGVRKLTGANVEATDLRGGATLVLAGLAAKGKTKVNKIEYILRGYDGLDKKLSSLGAKIVLEEGDKF